MAKPITLSSWVHWTKLFQERPLLNRAVLDTVGYALPSILLTRNPVERKEQTLDRILVIGSAFFLAPLHAGLFLKLFSRKLPSKLLMRMPYRNLLNLETFQKGLSQLSQEILQDSRGKLHWSAEGRLFTDKPYADGVRQQIIRQKTHMLLWDLLAEALIFTNLRFVTNWFTNHMTGKNQFSGEYGIVAQEKLDQLHQQQKKSHHFSERFKQTFNNVLAVVVPPVVALSLRHAILNPENTSGWAKALRRIASGFDYSKGIYMGMGALGVVVAMQLLGYAMAARDKYELREKMLVQNIGNYIFFLGNWTWMNLLGRLVMGRSKLPAVRSIQEALEKVSKVGATPEKLRKASKRAAIFYWLCFLLNNLSFASLVVATNKSTTERVKIDAARLGKEKTPVNATTQKFPAVSCPLPFALQPKAVSQAVIIRPPMAPREFVRPQPFLYPGGRMQMPQPSPDALLNRF